MILHSLSLNEVQLWLRRSDLPILNMLIMEFNYQTFFILNFTYGVKEMVVLLMMGAVLLIFKNWHAQFLPFFSCQRVNQCLRVACHEEKFSNCMELIDCGHADRDTSRQFLLNNITNQNNQTWLQSTGAINCFNESNPNFDFGIYDKAVNLVAEPSVITRYVYSLFWGFQVCLSLYTQ